MLADDCIRRDCIKRNNGRGRGREREREREYVFVKETQWLLKQNGKAGC